MLEAVCKAKRDQVAEKTVLFTFRQADLRRQSLLTEEERRQTALSLGMDEILCLPFTREFRDTEPEVFVREFLLERMSAAMLAVGDDFCFGKDRAGNVDLLRDLSRCLGFQLVVIPRVRMDGDVVSSSRIRDLLLLGEMEKVTALLGTPYEIYGPVIHGRALGRRLGFPTINQQFSPEKLLPPYGVYSSMTKLDGAFHPSVTNVGCKPSVGAEPVPLAETYVFAVEGDLYGKEAWVQLHHKIRSETYFPDLAALKDQIARDRAAAQQDLAEKGLWEF